MKNEYQEYFLSIDPKEIEQERKKRSALISLFPKTSGKEDKTIYVLLNNDEPKQISNSDVKAFSKPNTGVVFNKNDNPKGQQNKQVFKAPDFKSSNTKTPHANNHLTHENFHSTPYSFKSLTNELKSTFCTKIKPVANNNLKADSTKVYNQPDSIWNTDREHRTSMGNNMPKANNAEQSKNTLKLRYFPTGEKYTHQINELKARLPKGVQNVLNELGTEIRVGYNLHTIDKDSVRTDRNGIYNANKITLDSKHVNYETLFAEAMHAVQNYLGILGYSNAEFQELVVKDMYFKHIGGGYGISTTWDEDRKFSDFMDKSFTNKNNDTIDINKFLTEVPNQIEGFKQRYKDYPKYSSNFKDDFNYNWIDLFNILGIPLKFK